MKWPALFLYVTIGLAGASCSGHDSELNTLPPTFILALDLHSRDVQTGDLYRALMKVGNAYGLSVHGSGTNNGINWRIMWYCGKNATATAITTEAGDLIMFQAYLYGFKRAEDYERYKSEVLQLMKQFGTVTRLEERQPLSKEDLAKRERYMKIDLTSQCHGSRQEK